LEAYKRLAVKEQLSFYVQTSLFL